MELRSCNKIKTNERKKKRRKKESMRKKPYKHTPADCQGQSQYVAYGYEFAMREQAQAM